MNCRIELPNTKLKDDGQSLNSMQCELLKWAEDLFGLRDESWTLIPPMFGCKNPKISFPDLPTIGSIKLVQIKLGHRANHTDALADYSVFNPGDS